MFRRKARCVVCGTEQTITSGNVIDTYRGLFLDWHYLSHTVDTVFGHIKIECPQCVEQCSLIEDAETFNRHIIHVISEIEYEQRRLQNSKTQIISPDDYLRGLRRSPPLTSSTDSNT